jgi:hypothetical protein
MTNPIRFLFERLTERIFGLIGSNLGNAVSACRVACEAEQQSALEDLARKYEAEGKQLLADRLRLQAAAITSSDPASDGASVLDHLGCNAVTPSLTEIKPEEPAPRQTPRRKRRSRLSSTTPVDDTLGPPTSNDGGV